MAAYTPTRKALKLASMVALRQAVCHPLRITSLVVRFRALQELQRSGNEESGSVEPLVWGTQNGVPIRNDWEGRADTVEAPTHLN